MNGHEDPDMRSLGAYVEQSDALLGVLSVRETIEFAARLRYVLVISPGTFCSRRLTNSRFG